jgi:hypothetical protein
MRWAAFWAILSQTHLVALAITYPVEQYIQKQLTMQKVLQI